MKATVKQKPAFPPENDTERRAAINEFTAQTDSTARRQRFSVMLSNAIRDSWKPLSAERSGPARHLNRLSKLLDDMKQEREGEEAGFLLGAALGAQCSFEELVEAVERAIKFARPKTGAPRGTRGNIGFDYFLLQTMTAADACGIRWTAYRDRANRDARGSMVWLLRSLEASEDLPSGFVPRSDATLIKAIERMKHRLHPKK